MARAAIRSQATELFMDLVNELTELTEQDRLDLAEICCHPESELSWTCEALGGKSKRLSIGTGYALLTEDGTQSALDELVTRSPRCSWFSTPCTPILRLAAR